MKCPFCGGNEHRVVDSRPGKDGLTIRRRRECGGCKRRFTTFEQVEDIPVMVVKKDGRRELFSRDKVRAGILRACEKRGVGLHAIEGFLDELERDLREREEKEVPASVIGEAVMRQLQRLDDVAYVRFASVYREFADVEDFVSELKSLRDRGGKTETPDDR